MRAKKATQHEVPRSRFIFECLERGLRQKATGGKTALLGKLGSGKAGACLKAPQEAREAAFYVCLVGR